MKTRNLLILFSVVAALLLAPVWYVGAQRPTGPSQSDHALLDASVPEHVHCGVGHHPEGYTLHFAASSAIAATLTITFGDLSTIQFLIPAGQSFSTTQELGGVPTVDDLVRINLSSGGYGERKS